MICRLHAHLLPSLVEAEALNGGTAVIIDILRASSTMITALQNGAARVIPCSTTEEAFRLRGQAPSEATILGGERGGVRIPGFDLGNSPAEYRSETVKGRTVVFTTTNGTKAILKASAASKVLIGAFLNRQSIVQRLQQEQRDCHLICAGTDGIVTGEDVLFAGAVVDGLMGVNALDNGEFQSPQWCLNDSADMAWSFWKTQVGEAAFHAREESSLNQCLALAMLNTQGGRNLVGLGYESDITLCSQIDQYTTTPTLDRHENCLFAS